MTTIQNFKMLCFLLNNFDKANAAQLLTTMNDFLQY